MPRYVILEHDHPVTHWDLLLEAGETLHTWRLSVAPAEGVVIDAVRLADHRLLYLDYEGPVRGGRGQVRGWDRGAFRPEKRSDRLLIIHLNGERLNGVLRLECQRDDRWRACFRTEKE